MFDDAITLNNATQIFASVVFCDNLAILGVELLDLDKCAIIGEGTGRLLQGNQSKT